jgi:hypothetical protein
MGALSRKLEKAERRAMPFPDGHLSPPGAYMGEHLDQRQLWRAVEPSGVPPMLRVPLTFHVV